MCWSNRKPYDTAVYGVRNLDRPILQESKGPTRTLNNSLLRVASAPLAHASITETEDASGLNGVEAEIPPKRKYSSVGWDNQSKHEIARKRCKP